MLPPGEFTFGRALREWCFLQVPLLSLRDFQKALKARGLSELGLMSRDPWETLDREGIFEPVAYSLGGSWTYEVPGWLDAGALLVREDCGYRPWAELRAEAEEHHGGELTVLYHHWQLLAFAGLEAAMKVPFVPGNLGDGLRSFYETREAVAKLPEEGLPLEGLRQVGNRMRAVELMLVRVQNFFMPSERDGRYIAGPILGLTDGDAADWTIDERERFDYAAAAKECQVTADELADIYRRLGVRANIIDPNQHLFWLLDQVARRHKERLQGDALRALDYYDAARVIRRWYYRLTDEWLPDVDELIGWNADRAKEQLFGKRDLRYDRSVLPALLDHYGLYPWRVELIGEGASEIDALREVLDYGYGLTFERLGIHTTAIGTADIPANAEQLLTSMRKYANYFLLVFDNEGRARELIDELLKRGVIEGVSDQQRAKALTDGLQAVRAQTFATDEERRQALREARERARRLEEEPGQAPEFQLWKENLEADNFSLGELCAVLDEEAARRSITGFCLTEEEVAAGLDAEQTRPAQSRRGVATVILGLAEAKDPPLRLGKPEYARLLGRYAVENAEHDGAERPILSLAEHLVLLTGAGRGLRGGLR